MYMADVAGRIGTVPPLAFALGEQVGRDEVLGDHGDIFAAKRPAGARAIAAELDPQASGVGQVEGLADAVVAGALKRGLRVEQSAQPASESGPTRCTVGDVEETGGAGWRTSGTGEFGQADQVRLLTGCRQPGVEPLAADAAEAEQVPVKREGALQVGDLQVYRADGGRGCKSVRVHRVGSGARRATRAKTATEMTVVAAPVRKTLL